MQQNLKKELEKEVKEEIKFFSDKHYFDWWSLIHFSTGIITGLILVYLNINFFISTAIAISLFVLWEIIEPPLMEHILNLKFLENLSNQIFDVMINTIGFFLVYVVSFFVSVLILISALSAFFLAWLVFEKFKPRKGKLGYK